MINIKKIKEIFKTLKLNGITIIPNKINLKIWKFHFIQKGKYSQHSQDILAESLLKKFFPNQSNFYEILDIGSNHPQIFNNTYYFFEKKNANIISIDANPGFKKIWEKFNRIYINMAIGKESGEISLKIPTEKDENFVFASTNEEFLIKRNLKNYKSVLVKKDKLENIIEPQNFDLLFIDVEGSEMEVLSGINFSIFSFKIIFIENNLNQKQEIRNFLLNKNYRFYGKIGLIDDIFILNDV